MSSKKEIKLTPKQKEILITITVVILSATIGIFIGKYLFQIFSQLS